MAKKRAREADGAAADSNKMNVDDDSSDDDVSCDLSPRLLDAGGRRPHALPLSQNSFF